MVQGSRKMTMTIGGGAIAVVVLLVILFIYTKLEYGQKKEEVATEAQIKAGKRLGAKEGTIVTGEKIYILEKEQSIMITEPNRITVLMIPQLKEFVTIFKTETYLFMTKKNWKRIDSGSSASRCSKCYEKKEEKQITYVCVCKRSWICLECFPVWRLTQLLGESILGSRCFSCGLTVSMVYSTIRLDQVKDAKSLLHGHIPSPSRDSTGILQYPIQREGDYYYKSTDKVIIRNICLNSSIIMSVLPRARFTIGENVWIIDGMPEKISSVHEMMSLSVGTSPNNDIIYLRRGEEEGSISKISFTDDRIIIRSKIIDASDKDISFLMDKMGFYHDNVAESLSITDNLDVRTKGVLCPGSVESVELRGHAIRLFQNIRFSNHLSPKKLNLECFRSEFVLNALPKDLVLPCLEDLILKEYAVNFLPYFNFSSNLQLKSIVLKCTDEGKTKIGMFGNGVNIPVLETLKAQGKAINILPVIYTATNNVLKDVIIGTEGSYDDSDIDPKAWKNICGLGNLGRIGNLRLGSTGSYLMKYIFTDRREYTIDNLELYISGLTAATSKSFKEGMLLVGLKSLRLENKAVEILPRLVFQESRDLHLLLKGDNKYRENFMIRDLHSLTLTEEGVCVLNHLNIEDLPGKLKMIKVKSINPNLRFNMRRLRELELEGTDEAETPKILNTFEWNSMESLESLSIDSLTQKTDLSIPLKNIKEISLKKSAVMLLENIVLHENLVLDKLSITQSIAKDFVQFSRRILLKGAKDVKVSGSAVNNIPMISFDKENVTEMLCVDCEPNEVLEEWDNIGDGELCLGKVLQFAFKSTEVGDRLVRKFSNS
eukprot:GHVP01026400.1.p1 GENE.GHVP01026400.1~~GHVP01026400.1.p1  ORF type:complete len:827 (+),score=104.99 GHVP01026400.1:2182-4662(+)